MLLRNNHLTGKHTEHFFIDLDLSRNYPNTRRKQKHLDALQNILVGYCLIPVKLKATFLTKTK